MHGRRKLLLGIIVVLLLLGAGTAFLLLQSRSRRQVRIELDGSPSVRVKGIIEADGAVSEFEGSLPAALVVRGDYVTYTFRKVAGPDGERISVKVLVEGAVHSTVRSDHGAKGIVGSDSPLAGVFGRGSNMAASLGPTEE